MWKSLSHVNLCRLLEEISEIEAARPLREADQYTVPAAPFLGYTEDLQGLSPFLVFGGSLFAIIFKYIL